MKILFLSGGLEAGKDSVGDYTRTLLWKELLTKLASAEKLQAKLESYRSSLARRGLRASFSPSDGHLLQ